ncbi:MAG: DUF1573 domain-containing protein [Phycisphaerales bacterium]
MMTSNRFMQRMCAISFSAFALCAAGASAQPGHEGHNHAPGQHGTPAELQPIPVRPGTQPDVAGPNARSILVFKETTVSTGEILDIESVPVEFEFKNTGSEALEIQLVKPSCGCTVPDMEQKVYAPGESGTMKVTFDPSGKKGPISRVITIYTNSKTKPVHSIYLQSFVKPAVVTEPNILAFDLTQKGQTATKDIKVYGRFPEFKVSRATTPDTDVFGIEVIKGGPVEKDGETLYMHTIRVTVLESARPDNHRTEITVRTNDEHKPIFSLAVVGRVIGDLELTPVRMTMGRLVVGDEFTREITLRSKSGEAFEIKSVSSSNVVLDAAYTATPVDAQKRNEWTISVKGSVLHPAQRFNAQLTVLTDVADEEELTVQMYGQLQPKAP